MNLISAYMHAKLISGKSERLAREKFRPGIIVVVNAVTMSTYTPFPKHISLTISPPQIRDVERHDLIKVPKKSYY